MHETEDQKAERQEREAGAVESLMVNVEDTLRETHGLTAIRAMHARGEGEYEALRAVEVRAQLGTIAEMHGVCPDAMIAIVLAEYGPHAIAE